MPTDANEKDSKSRIEIIINEDMMEAYVVFNMPQNELDDYSKERLTNEVLNELKKKGVIYGIKREFLMVSFKTYVKYLIAEGIKPVNGEDSIISTYEFLNAKPVLGESERVDFYDVQLLNRIKAGDWLGERINATDGLPGKNIKGETILQKKGINYPLYYDRKSVVEIKSGNKTTLYAKNDGVVSYEDKNIFISNHLVIDGDVGFKTGSIEFDGFVTVKGSVFDGFSVTATKDIEILGEMGLGNVKKIESIAGSIFVKGGIASKESSYIYAKTDVYVKFVENANITCDGIVSIGFYCINSRISAKQVLVESTKGKIIGGTVNALMKVSSPYLGAESEKKTVIEITGFDRNSIVERNKEIDIKIVKYNLYKKSLQDSVDYNSEILLNGDSGEIISRLFTIKEKLTALEKEKKELQVDLAVKATGEVQVLKKIYPGVRLVINGFIMDIRNSDLGGSYILDGDKIVKV